LLIIRGPRNHTLYAALDDRLGWRPKEVLEISVGMQKHAP